MMWGLLGPRTQATVLIFAGALLAAAIDAVAAGTAWVAMNGWQRGSLLATIIVTVGGTLLNFVWPVLWRWMPFLNKVVFPNMNGVWKGKLASTWIEPETGLNPSPIKAEITIVQGLFETTVLLATSESESSSSRCLLEYDRRAGVARLWYAYGNKARAGIAARSPRHEGVAWLEMNLRKSMSVREGEYFTDRKTGGEIRVSRSQG